MTTVDVMTVVGARPQFIKASAVSSAFEKLGIRELLVHTGQHFDANMSQVFFDELGMKPADVNLDIHGGGHGEQTGRMLIGLEQLMKKHQPRMVMVYGDTNTTLAAALSAAKLHIPVAHVEAGLRSFNKKMPEEVNRICTDHVSQLLFTPTEQANRNLAAEGFREEAITLCGDVMYDVALRCAPLARERSDVLQRLGLDAGKYALATFHRAENTDDHERLVAIVEGLARVHRTIPIVLPVHPRTKAALNEAGLWERADAELQLTDPVGYLDMVRLESEAALVLTDSGGVQKEAYFHRTPCVTLRDETEWNELVEHGFNILAGANSDAIEAAAKRMVSEEQDWSINLYGSGDAAGRIAARIAVAIESH